MLGNASGEDGEDKISLLTNTVTIRIPLRVHNSKFAARRFINRFLRVRREIALIAVEQNKSLNGLFCTYAERIS